MSCAEVGGVIVIGGGKVGVTFFLVDWRRSVAANLQTSNSADFGPQSAD